MKSPAWKATPQSGHGVPILCEASLLGPYFIIGDSIDKPSEPRAVLGREKKTEIGWREIVGAVRQVRKPPRVTRSYPAG